MKIEDLFKGFTGDFSQTFLIGLMTSVFVFLWSLLFVIPGIIKKYSYSMAYFIKADNPDYDWRKCIDASKAMMQGHKWDLFVLELSFIGWIIISYLLFGVGFLWLAPYMQASRAQFYESIKSSAYIQ
ncbi:MAG: DUF975 family protein [Clostridia bacterium]|nr:DUF975 family protein [Clostridia bacterium]